MACTDRWHTILLHTASVHPRPGHDAGAFQLPTGQALVSSCAGVAGRLPAAPEHPATGQHNQHRLQFAQLSRDWAASGCAVADACQPPSPLTTGRQQQRGAAATWRRLGAGSGARRRRRRCRSCFLATGRRTVSRQPICSSAGTGGEQAACSSGGRSSGHAVAGRTAAPAAVSRRRPNRHEHASQARDWVGARHASIRCPLPGRPIHARLDAGAGSCRCLHTCQRQRQRATPAPVALVIQAAGAAAEAAQQQRRGNPHICDSGSGGGSCCRPAWHWRRRCARCCRQRTALAVSADARQPAADAAAAGSLP